MLFLVWLVDVGAKWFENKEKFKQANFWPRCAGELSPCAPQEHTALRNVALYSHLLLLLSFHTCIHLFMCTRLLQTKGGTLLVFYHGALPEVRWYPHSQRSSWECCEVWPYHIPHINITLRNVILSTLETDLEKCLRLIFPNSNIKQFATL